jgi:hypothetical protein
VRKWNPTIVMAFAITKRLVLVVCTFAEEQASTTHSDLVINRTMTPCSRQSARDRHTKVAKG